MRCFNTPPMHTPSTRNIQLGVPLVGDGRWRSLRATALLLVLYGERVIPQVAASVGRAYHDASAVLVLLALELTCCAKDIKSAGSMWKPLGGERQLDW